MSQHYFHTHRHGEPITVVLGWDRPLGQYFLLVERREPFPGQEDYLHVDLPQPGATAPGLEQFRARLDELDIQVPPAMFEEVERDGANNVGNRLVVYGPDGDFCGGTRHAA